MHVHVRIALGKFNVLDVLLTDDDITCWNWMSYAKFNLKTKSRKFFFF